MTDKTIRVEVDADLEDLIPGFLRNRRADSGAIAAALEDGDMERIRVIGHSMKGAGGGYGFDMLTDIGADIEAAAMVCDKDKVRAAMTRLIDYLDRVDVVFV